MDAIEQIRKKYNDLGCKAAKIAVNRRVVELMLAKHKTEINRRTRDAWITGRTGYRSRLDAELAECYATALLERSKIQKRTAVALQEMAA